MPAETGFYTVLCAIVRRLLKGRIRFEGREFIPADGPLILIANHRHAFDPVAVGLAVKRPVAFLAKKELFTKRLSRWFLKKLLCIPIDRDNPDRDALRAAIKVLDGQGILGVFPEGTRSLDGQLLPFKSGATFIASQSPCTIVPMAVEGAERLLKPFSPPVSVRIGVPFRYEVKEGEKRRDALERVTKEQEAAVAALLTDAPAEVKPGNLSK